MAVGHASDKYSATCATGYGAATRSPRLGKWQDLLLDAEAGGRRANSTGVSLPDVVSATIPEAGQIAVYVSPISASVQVNQTQRFTATVTGTANIAVTWSVDGGPTNGEVTPSGLYTAPATVPGSVTVMVRATSQADRTKTGTATATVTVAPETEVSVSPPTASVQAGMTQQFTATVTGTTNTAVTWSVDGGPKNAG